MNNSKSSNPCTRCGRERIVLKTWKESIKTFDGVTEIEVADTICPNKDCQVIVDKQIFDQHEKYEATKRDKLQKAADFKTKMSNLRLSKPKKDANRL